jgi:hypothetical protein
VEVLVNHSETTKIALALTSLEAKALAHFVKRVDFEMVAGLASVSVVSYGKSEADLIWYALIELRRALAEATAAGEASRPCVVPFTVIPGPGPSTAIGVSDAEALPTSLAGRAEIHARQGPNRSRYRALAHVLAGVHDETTADDG